MKHPFAENRGKSKRLPLAGFAIFLIAHASILAWGWLPQQASAYELTGYAAKIGYLVEQWREQGGFPWWLPGYLMGNSTAGLLSFAGAIPPYLLGASLFGEIAGFKIAGILLVSLGGCAAYAFGARLSRDSWTGFATGCAYVLSAQVLARLGRQEHMTIVAAVPFVPLTFLMLLRIAERGAPVDAVLFAVFFSALTLCWVKIGATVVIPLAIFALWLLGSRPDCRANFFRAAFWILPLVLLLGVLPLLPLTREYRFMTVFELSPLRATQLTYSAKSGTAWLDRGGSFFEALPEAFRIDLGGYYLGAAGLLAAAIVIIRNWRKPDAEDRAWLGAFRVFLAGAWILFWLSFGPKSVIARHFEILALALKLPDWMIPLHWAALFAQAAVLYWLLPARRWRGPAFITLLAAYLFIPAFRIAEMLPIYRDLRAPDSFWILGGTFCWNVASAMGAVAMIRKIPGLQLRIAASACAFALAVWDAAPYGASFFKPGLPAALHADFAAARGFLAGRRAFGYVMPFSGRYFYLHIPRNGGRPLVAEALNQYFQYKEVARLEMFGYRKLSSLLDFAKLAGVSHIFIDKTDPDLPPSTCESYRRYVPVVFENDHFLILENQNLLYPAFFANRAAQGGEGMSEAANAIRLINREIITIASPDKTDRSVIQALPQARQIERDSSITGHFARVADADVIERKATGMTVRTNGAQGWLVFTFPFHPDWKAEVDGSPAPLFRASGGLLGISLSGNERQARITFAQPPWYAACLWGGLSAWGSVIALLAILSLTPISFRKRWMAARETGAPAGALELDRPPIQRPLLIIPTYNEAESIQILLNQALARLDAMEVLVIDDASPDGTAQLVKRHAEFGRRIHILERMSKQGLGTAYRTGFRWAMEHGYDAVIEMDADFSHDPADLHRLLMEMNSGADAVIGSRYIGGVRVINWPAHRLLLSMAASAYVRVLTGLPLTDATSGFKALRCAVLPEIDWRRLRSEGYGFQIELHYLLWRTGCRLVEIPIVFTERRGGKTKMSSGIATEAAWRTLQLALGAPPAARKHAAT